VDFIAATVTPQSSARSRISSDLIIVENVRVSLLRLRPAAGVRTHTVTDAFRMSSPATRSNMTSTATTPLQTTTGRRRRAEFSLRTQTHVLAATIKAPENLTPPLRAPPDQRADDVAGQPSNSPPADGTARDPEPGDPETAAVQLILIHKISDRRLQGHTSCTRRSSLWTCRS
jgi:hypothetical protein